MPASNRPSPSASSAMKDNRFPDASTESTPLLDSPLPPPAYPTVMALDRNDAAGPSDKRVEYDCGPSKDLEEAGVVPAAVHLHHRPNRPWSRGKILRLLLIASAHAILIWLILTAAWGRSSRKGHVQPNVPPGMGAPHMPYYCQKLHSRSSEYEFESLDEFRVDEQIRPYRERYHDIRGLISFVPASDQRATKIRTKVTISNNFPHADVTAEKTDAASLLIRSKSSDGSHAYHERDCTVVDVLVSIPVGTQLDLLDISSNWLSVDFHRLLDLELGALNIDLLAGGVDSKVALLSRRTHISRAYGPVQGVWALLDLLEIHTTAGMVDVEVKPGDADPDEPLPAVFSAYSTAGSISASFPIDDAGALPDREYHVHVKTEAGSVRGSYVHGYESAFESKSGSVNVRARPVSPEVSSAIRTSNGAGQTVVDVLTPLGEGEKALKSMSGEFISAVGQVRITFPVEWEGLAEVDTAVGSLHVEGKGLQIVEEGSHGAVGRWVKAVKGDGDSTVFVKSQAGAVEFVLQDSR